MNEKNDVIGFNFIEFNEYKGGSSKATKLLNRIFSVVIYSATQIILGNVVEF